jgi:hypothetical protein
MRWLRPAVDVLPATVEQLTPPERLRESLIATVRGEAGRARAGERAGPEGAAPAGRAARVKASEVYEVWVQRAGVMEGRSIFVLRSDGTADAAVPGSLSGAQPWR